MAGRRTYGHAVRDPPRSDGAVSGQVLGIDVGSGRRQTPTVCPFDKPSPRTIRQNIHAMSRPRGGAYRQSIGGPSRSDHPVGEDSLRINVNLTVVIRRMTSSIVLPTHEHASRP